MPLIWTAARLCLHAVCVALGFIYPAQMDFRPPGKAEASLRRTQWWWCPTTITQSGRPRPPDWQISHRLRGPFLFWCWAGSWTLIVLLCLLRWSHIITYPIQADRVIALCSGNHPVSLDELYGCEMCSAILGPRLYYYTENILYYFQQTGFFEGTSNL